MKTVKILYAPKCIKNAEMLNGFFNVAGMLTYITTRERNQCEYDIFLRYLPSHPCDFSHELDGSAF